MFKPPVKTETLFRTLWPQTNESDDRLKILDADLGGRPLAESLFQEMQEHGLHTGSQVLDLGCGLGQYTQQFAQVFGCQVIGVDPLESSLHQARQQTTDERVGYCLGKMEALPLADASIDWIWCYDAFNQVQNMQEGFQECARVLKTNGQMILYSALAPDWRSSTDLQAICTQMGMNLDTLMQTRVEKAFQAAGLVSRVAESTADVESPFFESFTGLEKRDYFRLAHLVRARKLFRQKLGEKAYAYVQACYLWQVQLMTGRIEYFVWRLAKA